jgi:hypothetical protein
LQPLHLYEARLDRLEKMTMLLRHESQVWRSRSGNNAWKTPGLYATMMQNGPKEAAKRPSEQAHDR